KAHGGLIDRCEAAGGDLLCALEPYAVGGRHLAQPDQTRPGVGRSRVDFQRAPVRGLCFGEAALEPLDLARADQCLHVARGCPERLLVAIPGLLQTTQQPKTRAETDPGLNIRRLPLQGATRRLPGSSITTYPQQSPHNSAASL